MDSAYEKLELKKLNYNSYLKVPELLQLQQMISDGPHHDEMFFIIIHQTAELWFKEALHETGILIEALREAHVSRALKVLRRLTAIIRLQVQQIQLLRTLTPVEFAGFREYLRPASGFQSVQFREIEFTFGVRDMFFLKFFKSMPEVQARLQLIATQRSVFDEFLLCLKGLGHPVPEGLVERDFSQPRPHDPELLEVLRRLYEDDDLRNEKLVLLCETLMDFDEFFSQWRQIHILSVGRTIGQKKGTGGSAGYKFLQSRSELRFFPELWEVRNLIGGGYGDAAGG